MEVEELIKQQKDGVDVARLKAGSELSVKTHNSTYILVTTKTPRELYASGGKKIPKRQKVFLTGSTYGGSCIKLGWIGIDMHMEIWLDDKRRLLTSPVKSIRVIGNDWFYDLG